MSIKHVNELAIKLLWGEDALTYHRSLKNLRATRDATFLAMTQAYDEVCVPAGAGEPYDYDMSELAENVTGFKAPFMAYNEARTALTQAKADSLDACLPALDANQPWLNRARRGISRFGAKISAF